MTREPISKDFMHFEPSYRSVHCWCTLNGLGGDERLTLENLFHLNLVFSNRRTPKRQQEALGVKGVWLKEPRPKEPQQKI